MDQQVKAIATNSGDPISNPEDPVSRKLFSDLHGHSK